MSPRGLLIKNNIQDVVYFTGHHIKIHKIKFVVSFFLNKDVLKKSKQYLYWCFKLQDYAEKMPIIYWC